MELPTMPKLEDFYLEGANYEDLYKAALDAWIEVCKEVVKYPDKNQLFDIVEEYLYGDGDGRS